MNVLPPRGECWCAAILRQSPLYARTTMVKMILALTRSIAIGLVSCLAGICLLVARAGGSESNVAESGSAIRTWRSVDGLPADSVTAIIQTRDGFLWVGRSAGLVRFDGTSFTKVKVDEPPTNVK